MIQESSPASDPDWPDDSGSSPPAPDPPGPGPASRSGHGPFPAGTIPGLSLLAVAVVTTVYFLDLLPGPRARFLDELDRKVESLLEALGQVQTLPPAPDGAAKPPPGEIPPLPAGGAVPVAARARELRAHFTRIAPALLNQAPEGLDAWGRQLQTRMAEHDRRIHLAVTRLRREGVKNPLLFRAGTRGDLPVEQVLDLDVPAWLLDIRQKMETNRKKRR